MAAPQHHITAAQLTAIAGGDERAFAQLFDHYQSKVLHVAYLLTHSETQAKDILQDVFLRLWIRRAQLPQIEQLDDWIFIVARNHSLNALTKNARAAIAGQEAADWLPSVDLSIERQLDAHSLEALVRAALQSVTVQQQKVFDLIRFQGLTREEAGTQLGLSPNTVKMHLVRATKAVRLYLANKLDYLSLFLLLEHFFKKN